MKQAPTYEELAARVEFLEHQRAESLDRSNKVIRQLSEDFKQLVDRSQDAIYQYDIESRTFPFFNKQFLAWYAIEENGKKMLSPKSVLLHIHPDDRDKARVARAKSLEPQRNGGEIEYRMLGADGETRVMHDRWTVVRDAAGQAVAIEGFIRDNTWRAQAEKEFELSMHNSLIGCYIVQGRRFQYVNPEFVRIMGYREDELIGTVSLQYVLPRYRDQVRANFIDMLKLKRDFPYEFCIRDKSGNTKWILEVATPIRYKGKRAALGYFMDITRSKQIENERLEKEKLRSIVEMAAAVGHELNNPLQVVLTCAHKLAPEGNGIPREDRLSRLLLDNIERMRGIIVKFQNITRYVTKDYVAGKKIIDIDGASNGHSGDDGEAVD